MSAPQPPSPIVFIDGVCVLCTGFATFLLRRLNTECAPKLKIASLQGHTAEKLLPPELRTPPLQGIVFWTPERTLSGPAAVWALLKHLPFPWRPLGICASWLPKALSQWAYGLIARNRYALFGKNETCRLPDAKEKDRLLD